MTATTPQCDTGGNCLELSSLEQNSQARLMKLESYLRERLSREIDVANLLPDSTSPLR